MQPRPSPSCQRGANFSFSRLLETSSLLPHASHLPRSAELIPVLHIGRRRPPCLRSQQPPQARQTLWSSATHQHVLSSVPKEKVLEVMELFSDDCQREGGCGHGQWQWEKRWEDKAATLLELLVALHSPWVSHVPRGICLLGGELWLYMICLWGKPFSFCIWMFGIFFLLVTLHFLGDDVRILCISIRNRGYWCLMRVRG